MDKKNVLGNKMISVLPIILAVISVSITLFQCNDNNFWGDESYTILMANNAKTFLDVATCDLANPPLFFLIFKLFTLVFGEKYWVYHLVSAVPTILLIVLSITGIKKNLGNVTSCIFILFLTMTSTGRAYSVEVRMYSWAAFFVTLCFYEGYNLIKNKGRNIYNWILFCIGGIGAAYVHYFAFAGVILLYLFVFLKLIMIDKKNIWKCSLAIFASTIAYLPWITIFISAVAQITADFWISNTVSIKDGFKYIFESKIILILYIILLGSNVVMYIYKFISKTHGKLRMVCDKAIKYDDDIVWMSMSIFLTAIIIFIFEITYGKLFGAVFVCRYIYPVAVAIWLSFAMLVGNLTQDKFKNPVTILIFILILVAYTAGFLYQIKDYNERNKETTETIEIVNDYIANKKIFILTENTHYIWTVLKQYFPHTNYAWIDKETKYDFSNMDIDTVLLFMNAELSEEELETYEKNIGMKLQYVKNSVFADSYYYLYVAKFE